MAELFLQVYDYPLPLTETQWELVKEIAFRHMQFKTTDEIIGNQIKDIDYSAFSKKLGIKPETIGKELAKLRKKGVIIKVGMKEYINPKHFVRCDREEREITLKNLNSLEPPPPKYSFSKVVSADLNDINRKVWEDNSVRGEYKEHGNHVYHDQERNLAW